MRVLITGITGFAGRALAAHLLGRSDVVLFGADILPPAAGSGLCNEYQRCDVRDQHDVDRVVAASRPDWVFHLAGIFAGEAAELLRTNTLASVILFDSVLRHCPQAKVLVTGSAAEYGPAAEDRLPLVESHVCQPEKAYGISKLAATQMALFYNRTRGLRVVVARPFNVVGPGAPGQLVVGAVVARIREAVGKGAKAIKIGSLRTRRDFLDVRDLVGAYVRLLDGEFSGEIFNLCSGRAVEIEEVVRQLVVISGSELTMEVDPALLQALDTDAAYGSYAKAHSAIGFEPTVALEESLRAAWTHGHADRPA